MSLRSLAKHEIKQLQLQGCYADDWTRILVEEECDLSAVLSCRFYAPVSIGVIKSGSRRHDGVLLPEGLYDSSFNNTTIGSHPVIHRVGMIANYNIGDNCILTTIDQMIGDDCNNPKLEWMEVMNENGHRRILPFAGMTIGDAYLWARYRGHDKLMERLEAITVACRHSEGALNRIGANAVISRCRSICRVAVLSNENAPTVIEDCVALHDGVVGEGNRLSMGVMAERFLLGENVHLEMGARLNDAVVGDNSTIARCEVGCSLIFPAHEQHHNNSFLIATLIQGQSNVAAGATIGSNHNSRTADGEIVAGRGFWPGLCTSLKHNSRFASYCLLAKGAYPAELNIPFPFALVNNNCSTDELEIMPAYWWMYNMYALDRNAHKFAARDKRVCKRQHIEFDLWSPDVAEEILNALQILQLPEAELNERLTHIEHGKRNVKLLKAKEALEAYKEMLLYYCLKTLQECFNGELPRIKEVETCHSWCNIGGEVMTVNNLEQLISEVESGKLASWQQIHAFTDKVWENYPTQKAAHAYSLLCQMLSVKTIDAVQWKKLSLKYNQLQQLITDRIASSRAKDEINEFRKATSESEEEYRMVYGIK